MKVAFVIHSLHDKSGTQRVACHLANLFVEHLGYQVDIINRDTVFENVAYNLDRRVQVDAFEGNYWHFYQKLQAYLDKHQPEFLVIHNMGRLSLLCSFLNKKNTKIVSLEHVAFNSRPHWVKFFSKYGCYQRLDCVVSLTNNDVVNYQNWFKKAVVIYNISPFSLPNQPMQKNKKIISIGRLTYQKNFQALLMAWEKLQSDIDDWVLEIYGTGEDFNELQRIINENHLKNVYLMGETVNVEDIYKKSSLFVMSSRYEGLPMVLIEAQTFGLPIVSFDCPHGPAEIIHHQKNGLLVENQNVDLLAQSLLELMQNEQKKEQFSARAFNDAVKFQPESILNVWKNLFSELQ